MLNLKIIFTFVMYVMEQGWKRPKIRSKMGKKIEIEGVRKRQRKKNSMWKRQRKERNMIRRERDICSKRGKERERDKSFEKIKKKY